MHYCNEINKKGVFLHENSQSAILPRSSLLAGSKHIDETKKGVQVQWSPSYKATLGEWKIWPY